MKALTLWQPWCSLIVAGAKPYEFRHWLPPRSLIGQRLALHAGARPISLWEVRALLAGVRGTLGSQSPCLHRKPALALLERVERGLIEANQASTRNSAFRLPRAAVIGVATVGEPKRGDECAREFGVNYGNDSDRGDTFNWGWPMLDVKPLLPPVEWKGRQGLFDVPDNLIEEALAA